MSVDALLHHPLAVALESVPLEDDAVVKWNCRTPVGTGADYVCVKKPERMRRGSQALSEADVSALATAWLRRRGVSLHCTHLGLICPRNKRLWVADMIGERRDRLVLAVTYFSPKRRGRARSEMRQYAQQIADACRRVYKIHGAWVALINVYGQGGVEGEIIVDPVSPVPTGGHSRRPAIRRIPPRS
jgi:hypothetical protein